MIGALPAVGLLAVLAIVAAPAAPAAPARVVAATAPPPTTAANRRAAIEDAARLLAGVMPPSGSVVVERRSAIGVQARVPLITSAFASALDSEQWSVPGEPGAVLSHVESHLPPGSKLLSTGSSGPNPVSQFVIRFWPAVNGVLDARFLKIAVAPRSSGRTLLSAESQSQWVVARSARERIPAAVSYVQITDGVPGKAPRLSRSVTASRAVKRLVALFNSLGVVQPGSINCPAETQGSTVTVVFRRWATGRVLASASFDGGADFSWPDSVPGWACFPIGLVIDGRRVDPLIGNVVTPIDRLLHVRLARTA